MPRINYCITISAVMRHGEFIEEEYHYCTFSSDVAILSAMIKFKNSMDTEDYEILDIRCRVEREEE